MTVTEDLRPATPASAQHPSGFFDGPSPWTKAARVGRLLMPLLSFGLAIAVWQALVYLLDLPRYVLPSPHEVLDDLWFGLVTAPRESGFLAPQGYYLMTLQTLKVAGIGFVIGVSVAVVVGILASMSTWIDRLIMPLIGALEAIPKIALVPLFIVWFGFGEENRIATTAVVCWFPMLITTRAGLLSISPERAMMAKLFEANRLRKLRHVTIPSALPHMISGIELAVLSAILGAVVAELLSGSEGIGARLIQFQASASIASMFSVLVLLAIVGGSLYRGISVLLRRQIFWQ
jgi:NitT/TauT family transport system permease protein